jgi:hypothetical protein
LAGVENSTGWFSNFLMPGDQYFAQDLGKKGELHAPETDGVPPE